MSWWRAHDGAVDDPKLQRLPPELFKAWFNLLCIANRHKGFLPPIADVAFTLRVSEEHATEWLEQLRVLGLFDDTKRGMEPHNWNGRQYKSDVSTERVKRFRKRSETVSRNAPEQSQSRAETEQTVAKATDTPRKERTHGSGTRIPSDWQPDASCRDFAADRGIDPESTGGAFVDYWTANNGRTAVKRDWNAAFRTWCRRTVADAGSAVGGRGVGPLRPPRGNDSVFEHLAVLANQDRGPGSASGGK